MSPSRSRSGAHSYSKPQPHVLRKWSLKRKPRIRRAEEGDLAYAYAAYKKGASLGLPDGLDVDEFKQLFSEHLQRLGYGEFWTPLEGQKPLGLVGIDSWEHRVFPHVLWYPWATSRQRLEQTVHFMNELRKSRPVFVHAREEDRKIFDKLCDYKVFRIVGKPNNWFSDGESAIEYQSLELT